MSIIQKIESGYLQLLRILLLLLATGAVVAAVILGAQYVAGHDAKPAVVKDEITLSLANYQSALDAPADSPGQHPQAKAKAGAKDALLIEFIKTIDHFLKTGNPNAFVNESGATEGFIKFESAPELGRPFIKQLIVIINAATKDRKIADRIKQASSEELGSLVEYSVREYKEKTAAINAEKARAIDDAQAVRTQANWSLYAAGAGFIAFAGLILLVVLLKIERNLRGGINSVTEHTRDPLNTGIPPA